MNEEIITIFHYNHYVLNRNLNDITQEESLISSDAGGNCINWILGHIVVTRDALHETAGLKTLCDEKTEKTYVRGSEPVSKDNAKEIQTLLKIYEQSQQMLLELLNTKDFREDVELSKTLAGFGFHEAYHVGQTGILRRVIGKTGTIK